MGINEYKFSQLIITQYFSFLVYGNEKLQNLGNSDNNGNIFQDDEWNRARYGSSVPAHMRHHRSGQVVIETEENLSDKEIYPSNLSLIHI